MRGFNNLTMPQRVTGGLIIGLASAALSLTPQQSAHASESAQTVLTGSDFNSSSPEPVAPSQGGMETDGATGEPDPSGEPGGEPDPGEAEKANGESPEPKDPCDIRDNVPPECGTPSGSPTPSIPQSPPPTTPVSTAPAPSDSDLPVLPTPGASEPTTVHIPGSDVPDGPHSSDEAIQGLGGNSVIRTIKISGLAAMVLSLFTAAGAFARRRFFNGASDVSEKGA
jgi:hypothetical protein